MKLSNINLNLTALGLVLLLGLGACSTTEKTPPVGDEKVATSEERIKSSGKGRYTQQVDSRPENPKDVSQIANAVPKVEAKSKYGNPTSYKVFGETYKVMASSQGFTQTGIASWYGNKFHGHLTANGEIYDMYAMTAAHTSLPLPTYLRVTNLSNQRQVIVRVNDRGPFIHNRVLDLSYAAAAKLDMLQAGVAKVKIEAIDPVTWQAQRNAQPAYLQVAALSNAEAARKLETRVKQLTKQPSRIVSTASLYRVQLGPVSRQQMPRVIQQLEDAQLGKPLIINP